MKKIIIKSLTAMLLICGILTGCGSRREAANINVGSLKGPTSLGLLYLIEDMENEKTENTYNFTMATGADEIAPLMIKGELDIALVPANMASVIYNKTEGQVTVIDINTLGVLYIVSGDDSITEISDLKDRVIYLTGQGTTPDFVLKYVLENNGLSQDDYSVEYKSEATEVAAVLAENEEAVGILPQPFVTAACMQNENLKILFDMDNEWNKIRGEGNGSLVTGVTIVRNEFLEEHKDAIDIFLEEHAESVEAVNADPETGAEYAVKREIVAKAPIAQKAIPSCNITCITGEDMKKALEGYLEVIYENSQEFLGGELPGEDFYYIP